MAIYLITAAYFFRASPSHYSWTSCWNSRSRKTSSSSMVGMLQSCCARKQNWNEEYFYHWIILSSKRWAHWFTINALFHRRDGLRNPGPPNFLCVNASAIYTNWSRKLTWNQSIRRRWHGLPFELHDQWQVISTSWHCQVQYKYVKIRGSRIDVVIFCSLHLSSMVFELSLYFDYKIVVFFCFSAHICMGNWISWQRWTHWL